MTGNADDRDLVVLKLGGSVITEKEAHETVDEPTLQSAAAAIGGSIDRIDLLVVHGGGSFGHVHAAAHGVSTTDGSRDREAMAAIHGAMKRLNGAVVDALAAESVPTVPVHPLSLAARDRNATLTMGIDGITRLLSEGFVPVLHGDVIAHGGRGVTVLSGDEIVTYLAEELRADRIGVCSTVPGVLDDDGDVVDVIEEYETIAPVLGDSEATDVSGGMAGKVRQLLSVGTPASVFGPESIEPFLRGDTPGTLIRG